MGWGALGCRNLTAFGARGGVARDVTLTPELSVTSVTMFQSPTHKVSP